MEPVKSVVVDSDPGKILRLLALSVVFVVGGLYMVATSPSLQVTIMGFAATAFFGAVGALLLAAVVRPPRLVLDDAGVSYRGLRSWHVPWGDVNRFRVVRQGRRSSVAIDYRSDAHPGRAWRLRRPRSIADTLRVAPDELVSLLQARLALGRGAADQRGPQVSVDNGLAVPRRSFPRVTTGLIVCLALVFAAEVRFPVTPASTSLQPSIPTLVAFGGLDRLLALGRGEWFRLVTAPFLHGNVTHVFFNALALFWAGWLLEGLVGRWWFAAIYAVGALAGGLVSMAMNPPNVVGVGASGAIMALFAAALFLSFHYPNSTARSRLQTGAIRVLAPTLFNVAGSVGNLKVDVWAHAGGVVGGSLAGLLLLRMWSSRSPRPNGQAWARATVALAAALTAGATWPAARSYRSAADYARASHSFAEGALDEALALADASRARSTRADEAWSLDGDLLLARGDAKGAVAAYDRAYDLAPSPAVLRVRGLARFYAGDGAGAVRDLDGAVAGDGADPYGPIWLDIVRERQGLGASLTPDGLAAAGTDWPQPVARLFAGLVTPDRLAEVASPQRSQESDQVCEADFYVAEWKRIKGDGPDVEDGFRKARQECPPTFVEAWMAQAELAGDKP